MEGEIFAKWNSSQEFSSKCSERYPGCSVHYSNVLVEVEYAEFRRLEQAIYFALGVNPHFRDP